MYWPVGPRCTAGPPCALRSLNSIPRYLTNNPIRLIAREIVDRLTSRADCRRACGWRGLLFFLGKRLGPCLTFRARSHGPVWRSFGPFGCLEPLRVVMYLRWYSSTPRFPGLESPDVALPRGSQASCASGYVSPSTALLRPAGPGRPDPGPGWALADYTGPDRRSRPFPGSGWSATMTWSTRSARYRLVWLQPDPLRASRRVLPEPLGVLHLERVCGWSVSSFCPGPYCDLNQSESIDLCSSGQQGCRQVENQTTLPEATVDGSVDCGSPGVGRVVPWRGQPVALGERAGLGLLDHRPGRDPQQHTLLLLRPVVRPAAGRRRRSSSTSGLSPRSGTPRGWARPEDCWTAEIRR